MRYISIFLQSSIGRRNAIVEDEIKERLGRIRQAMENIRQEVIFSERKIYFRWK